MRDIVKLFSKSPPKFVGMYADELGYILQRFSMATSIFLIAFVPAWAWASTPPGTDPMTEYGLVGIVIAVLAKDLAKMRPAKILPKSVDEGEILHRERTRIGLEKIESIEEDTRANTIAIRELQARRG